MGDGPIPEAWITREYVEKLRADLDEARDNERKLARYVDEAAGPESCLIPIASLIAISAETNRLRTEIREALGVVRQFAPSMAKQEPRDLAACIRAIWDMGSDALVQVRRERDYTRLHDLEARLWRETAMDLQDRIRPFGDLLLAHQIQVRSKLLPKPPERNYELGTAVMALAEVWANMKHCRHPDEHREVTSTTPMGSFTAENWRCQRCGQTGSTD